MVCMYVCMNSILCWLLCIYKYTHQFDYLNIYNISLDQDNTGWFEVMWHWLWLTVLLEDEQHTGEDLHDLRHHHGWGGQVPRALGLQGSGVAHGEHQGGGLEDQHAQGEVLEPGRSHGHGSVGRWRQKGEEDTEEVVREE